MIFSARMTEPVDGSRKPIMVALCFWQTESWSNLPVTKYSQERISLMSLSWSLGTLLGTKSSTILLVAFSESLTSTRATTHTDLVLRARELNVPVRSIPNASIMSAVGVTGLQLYNFGQTVSMVFFTETWKPSSFYDRVKENRSIGLHTLVLLDIKVKEQSIENLARGRKIFEPPRFMTAAQCACQMLETEEERSEGIYGSDSLAVAVARVGAKNQKIVSGTLQQLAEVDMGPPLHSLILLGSRVHDLERDYIKEFAVDEEVFDAVWKRDYEGKQ